MRLTTLSLIAGLLGLAAPAQAREPFYITQVPDEATRMRARDPDGNLYTLYKASHALVIGQAAYTRWDPLPAVRQEALELRDALESHRFKVEVHFDLRSDEFAAVVDQFMRRRATVPGSRILVYVSGHGWSRRPLTDRPFGYFVPVDAPPESQGSEALAAVALPMSYFEAWAKMPDPTHMLFIFDACFSGSFFGRPNLGGAPPGEAAPEQRAQTRTVAPQRRQTVPPPQPPTARGAEADDYVFRGPRRPVRQFLAAGGENEVAPKDSVFTRLLIEILSGRRQAQINFDHWTTATELGTWLAANTRREYRGRENPTDPIFGTLRDELFEAGDMTFSRLDLGSKFVETEPVPWNPERPLARQQPAPDRSPSPAEIGAALDRAAVVLRGATAQQATANRAQASLEQAAQQVIRSRRELAAFNPFQQQDLGHLRAQLDRAHELERRAQEDAQRQASLAEASRREAVSAVQQEVAQSSPQSASAAAEAARAAEATIRVSADRLVATAAISEQRRLTPDEESVLQSLVNSLSTDDTQRRRSARGELARYLGALPESKRDVAVTRLLRELWRKSYRYQVGVAMAIAGQPGVVTLADPAGARFEVERAAAALNERAINDAFKGALARLPR